MSSLDPAAAAEIRERVHRRLRIDEHAELLDAREEANAHRAAQRPRAAGSADAGRGASWAPPATSQTPLIELAFTARLEHNVNTFFGEDS